MNALLGVLVRPPEGVAIPVVESDVTHQLAPQIGRRGEDPAGNEIALDFAEPDLHLVEPRAVGRRVVDLDRRVGCEPVPDRPGLMRREIVADEVDLPPSWLGREDLIEKGEEGGTGMPFGGHAIDMAGVVVTVREEDYRRLDRAVIEQILEEVSLTPPVWDDYADRLQRSWTDG